MVCALWLVVGFYLRGVNSYDDEIKMFADGNIVGEHIGTARCSDPTFGRSVCKELVLIINDSEMDKDGQMSSMMAGYCAANFPPTGKFEPPKRVYPDVEPSSFEKSKKKKSLIAKRLRDITELLDSIFYRSKRTGHELIKMLSPSFWKEMEYVESTTVDKAKELRDMKHTPIRCDNHSVTVRVCRNINPTIQDGQLYKITHVGASMNNGTVCMMYIIPRYLMLSGNNTTMTHDCDNVGSNHYECNVDNETTSAVWYHAYPKMYHLLPSNRPSVVVRRQLKFFTFYVTVNMNMTVRDSKGTVVSKQIDRSGVFLQGFPRGDETEGLIDITLKQRKETELFSPELYPDQTNAPRKRTPDEIYCDYWSRNNEAKHDLCMRKMRGLPVKP